jgi:hypothetical protein
MKKTIVLIVAFCVNINIFSQSKLDNYKYFIVAENFDFLKKTDQYQTSSLTKFLFNKYKIEAFFNSDDLPEKAKEDRCNNLFVTIKSNSNMLVTKLSLEFIDCFDKVVYKSIEGRSRKKDYKAAYHEAIRNAFLDKAIQNYSFKKGAKPQKENKVVKLDKKVKEKILPKVIKNESKKVIAKSTVNSIQILYAQQNINGFQLVDTTPKIVFRVLKTSKKNIFILETKNGIVYPNGKNWTIEYYENGILTKKNYQIKF